MAIFMPAFKEGKLPDNKVGYSQLKEKIKALALPAPAKQNASPVAMINGKNFTTSANDLHIQNIGFNFSSDVCHVNFKTDAATYPVSFGAGKCNESETAMTVPSLTGNAIEKRDMLYPAKIAASYTWKDANTLELVLRYIESPHSETFTCRFDGNKLNVEVARSYNFGKNKIMIEAVQE